MLRAKWLTKLEEKKDVEILTRFKKKQYIKGYYNIVIKKYFLIDRLYILRELY